VILLKGGTGKERAAVDGLPSLVTALLFFYKNGGLSLTAGEPANPLKLHYL
jgi:hypothetical protein